MTLKDGFQIVLSNSVAVVADLDQCLSGVFKLDVNGIGLGIDGILDQFITLHPGNKDTGYAYYLKSMCFYERITDVGRDQENTNNAVQALTDVVRRYPNTEYARDARLKLDLTQDHLAGKEMYVGRYYMKANKHIAAINRFKYVIENYETTTHAQEALYRLVEAYLQLGIVEEAAAAAAVLGYNYPGSEWYEDAYRLLNKRDLIASNGMVVERQKDPADKAQAPERPVAPDTDWTYSPGSQPQTEKSTIPPPAGGDHDGDDL